MSELNDPFAREEAMKEWDRARQAARFEELIGMLTFRGTGGLLPFEEVRKSLRLTQKNYAGIDEVPLDRIRGSVGRYRDFTATFLPRTKGMRERWISVGALVGARGAPPVDLYRVGDAYFVLDGNHRVSIARQLGAKTIEAHVWEFPTPAGLSAHANLEEVVIRAEYADFLNQTGLKRLRPEAEILFTAPGGYREISYQITYYQQVMSEIDGEPFSYDDAVMAWYDLIYAPAVQIIQKKGLLDNFPNRTEADLFIWVWQNHQDLKKTGSKTLGSTADLLKKQEMRWLSRLISWLKRK